MRQLVVVILAGVLASGAYFYGRDLATAPAYPTPDEVIIALQSESIHATARDRHGRLLPVYFQVSPVSWFQPIAIYSQAAARMIAPFDIRTFRRTTVAFAILNGLLAWLALRAMVGPWSAIVGTVILLTAPAHFIHGRLAMDYLYPLPFILAWLWCLVEFDRRRTWPWLAAAGVALSCGFFSYASAMALMPAFFALTLCYLAMTSRIRRAWILCAAAALAFVWPVAWLAGHREMIADTFARYSVGDQAGLLHKLETYREYFEPTFLFRDSAGPALFSLRGWGLVLPASGVLFAAGVAGLLRRQNPMLFVLLPGLLLAALPAVIIDERHATQRVLPMVPFLAIIAALGFDFLWRLNPWPAARLLRTLAAATLLVGAAYLAWILTTESRIPGMAPPLIVAGALGLVPGVRPATATLGRVVAAALMFGLLWQFALFAKAYRDDYPRWSRILNGDLPGALATIGDLAVTTPAPAIYLDAYIDQLDDYWAFSTLSRGYRIDSHVVNYRPQDFKLESIPAGSLILVKRDPREPSAAVALPEADRIADIPELRGPVIYSIYRKP